MGKVITLIFIVFLGIIAYLALLNREPVSLSITQDVVYEIPKIALILISVTAGAFLMLVVYTMRDTKRLIGNIQTQKMQKRKEKIQNLYARALNALHSGRPDVAVNALKDILSVDPGNVQALLRLGEVHMDAGDYKRAMDCLKRALSSDPENTETLLSLVRIKEMTKAYEEAIAYADDILESDPKNIAALYKKRKLLEKLGRWDDLVYLQKGLLRNAGSEEERQKEQSLQIGYKYESGRESLESGNIEKAKKTFRAVIKLKKDFIPAHLGYAEVMIQEGNTEDAINYLERVYTERKSMIILARLEDLILGVGEPMRLINLYKKSIAGNPSDNVLKFFLAKLYYRLEMLDDALEMTGAIENPLAFPEITKIRGGIFMKRGQFEKASGEFRSALNMRMTLKIPYCCANCAYISDDWSGRCPSCGEWNSFFFNIHGACKL